MFSCRNHECPVPSIAKSVPPDTSANSSTPADTSANSDSRLDTLILQPGAEGKDAMIWHLDNTTTTFGDADDRNSGSDPEFPLMNWTFQGVPGIYNSLIAFDFSSIPSGSTIISAKLSLYACEDCGNAGHEARDGKTNPGLISRIIEPWDENTVTWNTKPAITSVNADTLPPSTSAFEDYTDIDVTKLTQDILDNPSTGYGFYCSIVDTDYYKKLIFASGDHTDPTKHPKLVIVYK